MISNEQRAHDIALALMAKNADPKNPIAAYHEYVTLLVPLLKELDRDQLGGQHGRQATFYPRPTRLS